MTTPPSSIPTLSVIMPVYNEEECIEEAVREVREHILAGVEGSELLVIDDGSRDRTGAILDQLARDHAEVKVIHKPNGGHGDAVLCGLREARGEYLFLLDSDRQIAVQDFAKLWARRGPAILVSGVRAKRYDPLHRLILTRMVRAGLYLFFGRTLRDANVPFKLLHRQVWEQFAPLMPAGALTPSLLLAVGAATEPRMTLKEVRVHHRPRETGICSLHLTKLSHFCARALGQLIEFRRALSRQRRIED